MSVAARRGHLEPRASTERRWRRIGVAVVRRSGALAVASIVVLLALAAVIPTFRVSYDESSVQIYGSDSTRGYDLVRKHWGGERGGPGVSAGPRRSRHAEHHRPRGAGAHGDLGVTVPGIAYVRSITRPDGRPLAESATGFSTGPSAVSSRTRTAGGRCRTRTPSSRSGVTALSAGADEAVRQMPRLVAGNRRGRRARRRCPHGGGTPERIVAVASRRDPHIAAGVGHWRASRTRCRRCSSRSTTTPRRTAGIADGLRSVFGPMLARADDPGFSRDPACAAARAAFLAVDRADRRPRRPGSARRDLGRPCSVAAVARARATLSGTAAAGLAQLQTLLDRLDGRSPEQMRAQLENSPTASPALSTGLGTLADGLAQAKAGTDQTAALTAELTAGLGRAADYLTTMSDAPARGRAPASTCRRRRSRTRVRRRDEAAHVARRALGRGCSSSGRSIPTATGRCRRVGAITDAARAGARGTVLERGRCLVDGSDVSVGGHEPAGAARLRSLRCRRCAGGPRDPRPVAAQPARAGPAGGGRAVVRSRRPSRQHPVLAAPARDRPRLVGDPRVRSWRWWRSAPTYSMLFASRIREQLPSRDGRRGDPGFSAPPAA